MPFHKEVLIPAITGFSIGSIIGLIFEEHQKRKREREQVMKILREVQEALEAKAQTQEA